MSGHGRSLTPLNVAERCEMDVDRALLKVAGYLDTDDQEIIRTFLVEVWCDGRFDGLRAGKEIFEQAMKHLRPRPAPPAVTHTGPRA